MFLLITLEYSTKHHPPTHIANNAREQSGRSLIPLLLLYLRSKTMMIGGPRMTFRFIPGDNFKTTIHNYICTIIHQKDKGTMAMLPY